jgi:hypothetical protein
MFNWLTRYMKNWYHEYLEYSNILKTLVGIKSFYILLWIFVILGVVSVNNLLYITMEAIFLIMLGIYGFYLFNPISERKLEKEDRLIGFTMAGFILWLIDYQHIWEVWKINLHRIRKRLRSTDPSNDEEEPSITSKSVIKGEQSVYNPVELTTQVLDTTSSYINYLTR